MHFSLRCFLSIFEWPLKTGFTVVRPVHLRNLAGAKHIQTNLTAGIRSIDKWPFYEFRSGHPEKNE